MPGNLYYKTNKPKNRPVPVRCVQTSAAGAVRTPGQCHFTQNDPTKRRTGAVEF